MSLEDRKQWGEVARALPSPYLTDHINAPVRLNRFGEQVGVVSGKPLYQHADEGEYFIATNPTPGTAIAGIAAAATADDTKTLLLVRNTAQVAQGTCIFLDYLRLLVNTAGTNGTNVRYMSKLEPGPAATRYTSGGSAITPVNANGASASPPIASVKFGALTTAAASSNARLVGNGLVRNVITVVGDVYTFDFGGLAVPQAAHAIAGTAIADVVVKHPPVVIPPQGEFLFCLYAASQTVASQFEFDIGWWER